MLIFHVYIIFIIYSFKKITQLFILPLSFKLKCLWYFCGSDNDDDINVYYKNTFCAHISVNLSLVGLERCLTHLSGQKLFCVQHTSPPHNVQSKPQMFTS